MRGIRFVELFANIKANIVAFFSVSMFVCLGLGLFLGIGWGATALRNAAHETLVKGNTSDIELQFPYGVTDDDLKQLKNVEGVTELETGYTSFAVMKDVNTSHTLKLQTMTDSINQPTSVVGNLPMEPDEVALLSFWAEKQGIVVGDTITLKHDAIDSTDADGMRYLTSDTFTVTALVDNPLYLSTNSAMLGVSNIGAGSIDCVGFVTKEAMDASAFGDGCTNVYIRCASLDGIQTLSEEYRNTISPIVSRIEELGQELGTAQYRKVHGKAQDKLDSAEQTIADGEQKLEDGKQLLADGEKQIEEGKEKLEEGQTKLVDSVQTGSAQQSSALQRLEEAYRQLMEGQAKYDAGRAAYNTAADMYNQLSSQFNGISGDYNLFTELVAGAQRTRNGLQSRLDALKSAYEQYQADPTDENWAQVVSAYNEVFSSITELKGMFGQLSNLSGSIGNAMGIPVSIENPVQQMPAQDLTPETVQSTISKLQAILDHVNKTLDRLSGASVTVEGVTITLLDIPSGMQTMADKLSGTKAELDSALARLTSGWDQYYAGKAQYDQGVADAQSKLAAGEQEIRDGKATLEQKQQELEDGKATLEQKQRELEDGKAKLEDAKTEFAKLVEYEWVVLPRQDCGGLQSLRTVCSMMDSVKWAMASLFVLVGLFVCYSAISRLVHEQIVQIGTKKAMGFHEGEIAWGYLAFSGLAVIMGIGISLLIAVFVVQLIMNPTAARQFCVPEYPPYVSVTDLLAMGGLEMLLILASTWFAIHDMLKRNAVELLSGESTANVKEHFYERTRLWQRMSLFSQTVVSNCVNDKRRVAGTLIGVTGCTALIVTAVTLASNVGNSFVHHYQEVYSYDSLVYLADGGEEQADEVAMALYKRGVDSSPAFIQQLQVRKEDGSRSVVRLIVPTNEDSFQKFYHVIATSGAKAEVENGGLWVSAAYSEHLGVNAGDEVTLTENTGKTHTFTVAGVFDYYLLRQEFVLSQREYRQAFGNVPDPNVMLVDTDGADKERICDTLMDVDGYGSLVDDYNEVSYAFDEMQRMLNIVVLIYLALSAAMAVVVLLNLDVMFVSEKKRELIVLMICGFSAKDAKAYIYRDSIVLTVLGILLGVVLGTIMGGLTVFALEPEIGFFIKSFNWVAALAGIVGAGVFATGVLFWALRAIPRFDLTDINRF